MNDGACTHLFGQRATLLGEETLVEAKGKVKELFGELFEEKFISDFPT